MPDTILVVGRNAVKLKYLKSLLSFHEYEIIEYSNFYNTLKLLQLAHSNISLIVFHFDRNENKNAEHLIERIRQETRYTKIPIMVLGEFSYKENVHLRRIGIEGIFNHDLPDKVIVRKIGNFIKRKRHEIKFTSHAHLARQTPLEEDPVFQKNSISSEQLLTLIEILNLIHMARNLDVLMSFIFKEVNRLIPFHSISITLKNTFDDKLMLYFRDSQDSKVLNKKPITLSTTNGPGRVFSVPHTLLQSDTHANATIQFEFEEVLNFNDVLLSSIRSAVIVPLIADREVIGTLNLGHNEIGFYTEDKLRVLRAVTPHITIAIENARLAEEVRELSNQLEHAMEEKDAEIQKKYYHLSLLNNVGYAMQGAVDLEKVLYLILTCVTAGGAIGFNRAILFKVNYDTRMIKGVMG
ncbi:MAG: GAF domain-containing protein [bacterium]|nr:GAF domain-containing protein [bacterium]